MALDDAFGVDPNQVLDDVVRQHAPDLTDNGVVDPNLMMDRLIKKHIYGSQRQQQQPKQTEKPDFESSTSKPLGDDEFYSGTRAEEAAPAPQQTETPQEQKPDWSLGEGASVFGRSAAQGAVKGVGAIPKAAALGPEIEKQAYDQTNQDYIATPEETPSAFRKEAKSRERQQAQAREDIAERMKTPVQERPAYKVGKGIQDWAEKAIPVSPEERAKYPISSQAGSMIGGAVPAVGAGIATSAVAGPAAGTAVAATIMGAQSAGDEFDRAAQSIDQRIAEERKAGYDDVADRMAATRDERAAKAAGFSAVLMGTTGALPVGVILAPAKTIAPGLVGRLWYVLDHAWKSGVTFTGVGEAQHYIGEQLAKEYDPDAKYDFDYKRLIAEFLAGGALGAGHAAIQGRPAAPPAPPPGAAPGGPGAGLPPPGTGPGGPAPGAAPGGPGAAPGTGPGAAPGGAPSRGEAWRAKWDTTPPPTEAEKARGAYDSLRTVFKEKYGFTDEDLANASMKDLRSFGNDADFLQANKVSADDIAKMTPAQMEEAVERIHGDRTDDVLRRAGYSDEDIAGMDATVKKQTAAEMRGYGVHAGEEPAKEGAREKPAKPAAPPTAETATGQTFTTAKGSTYQVHDDGTTTRNKAYRPEHGEAEQGLQPRSEKTVYVDKSKIGAFAKPENTSWRVADHGDGTVSFITRNPNGKWGVAPSSKNIKVSDSPAAGLTPIELWGKERLHEYGLDVYSKMHPGNEITKVTRPGTRSAAPDLKTAEDVKAATSVIHEDASHAQHEAHNIQLGHGKWNGLDLTFEVRAGGTRKGVSPEGKPYETKYAADYGYIRGLEAGADGDDVDFYMGPNPSSSKVFVIDELSQTGANKGKFKQTKPMLGFDTAEQAKAGYLGTSTKSEKSFGAITEMSVDEFKALAKAGGLSKPVGKQEAAAAEFGPEHVKAVEDRLAGIGERPKDLEPPDLVQRAARLHAQGMTPEDAIQVALVKAAIEKGVFTEEQAKQLYGKVIDVLHAGESSERELPAAPSGAAAGGKAAKAEQVGSILPGSGEAGEGAQARTGTKGAGGAGEAAAAVHPEEGRVSAVPESATGRERAASRRGTAEAGRDRTEGTAGGAATEGTAAGPAAVRPENLIGDRVTGLGIHKVTAADGTAIQVAPVVVEAKDLITSSDQGYDKSLQPRERERAASQAQIREIATRLDPERLGYSAEADRGAPIVGPDRMVESGNGRVQALRAVYRVNPTKAKAYRDWLTDQGVDVAKYKEPVLVRQRVSELSEEGRRAFTVASNQAATLAMSAPERAAADAKHLTPDMIGQIKADNLNSAENRPFIRSFISAIPASERGALATAEGALSAEGLARARNAILAKAYGDPDVLSRITESTDDDVKSISNALVSAAPAWARLRSDIEEGRVSKELDLTSELMEAVKRTAELRQRGEKLEEFLRQQDAFDKLPGPVEGFMRSFYDPAGRRAAGAPLIAKGLRFYAEEAAKATTEAKLDLGVPEVTAHDIQAAAAKEVEVPAGGEGVRPGDGPTGRRRQGPEPRARGQEPGAGRERGSKRYGLAQPTNPFEGSSPSPSERTRAGDQFVFPGAERITTAELARRRIAEPLRARKEQKPADFGLFGAPEKQADIVEEARKNERSDLQPAGVRPAAQAAPATARPTRPRRASKPGSIDQLSLFGGPSGGEPVREHPVGEEQRPGRAEPAVSPEGGEVTKPPARSQRAGDGRNRAPAKRGIAAAQQKIEERSRLNYRITDDDKVGVGGPKEKVRANLEAIRTLKAIEEEARNPTADEKAKLVRYTGWGAFAQPMFKEGKPEWKAERDALRAVLTKDEYEAARASTLNAHFTSPDVIKGIWGALDHLGFDGGLALEPAAGIGHFIGFTPDRIAPKTAWTATELDPITGRIAKALYGGAEVNVHGYEELKRPSNYYDLAISNVPFGDYSISEKPYGSFPIHDFFFVKSLDKVRPGGVVAFVTSRYTMDRVDEGTRRLLSRSADLVGAIRLPGGRKGAFSGNAGTEVTTDILFLRKKVPGEAPFPGANWTALKEIQTPEGPVSINEYFADHPEMMLGEMRLLGTMYRDNEPVLLGDPEGLREKIASAGTNMPAGAFLPRGKPPPETLSSYDMPGSVKDGAFFLKGDKLYRNERGEGKEQQLSKDDHDRVRRLAGIRDTVNDLLDAQLKPGSGDTEALRKKLRAAYDAFVRAHGPINRETRTVTARIGPDGEPLVITRVPNFAKFRPDPDAWKVAAIERYDAETDTAKPADIQLKDVIDAPRERQVNGPADALAAALDAKGSVDLDHIAESLGLDSHEAVVHALGDLVFQDPDGRQWQTADRYLSGDVVKKLEDARVLAKEDKTYQRNVEALEKVQPLPLGRHDIYAAFGAPWVPAAHYAAFFKDVLGATNAKVERVPITGEFKVNFGSVGRDALAKYGTERVDPIQIARAAINNRQVTVYDKHDDGSTSVNAKETELARVRTEALKEAFSGDLDTGGGWIWQDESRAQELEAIYNRTYNNLVPRKFDGSHLTFPGLNRDFATRQHRKDAVWRMVQQGNTLLAHVVGSGKTVTMIAGGMEAKRLGLINKPAYVVPNHMLEQFSREFIQAYPNAKILVASKDETSAENRKSFVAKVASNDWDGVVITHDAFGRLNMGKQFRQQHIQDQLDELDRVIDASLAEDGKNSPTVKELEKAKKRLEEKLKKLMNEERKDDGVSFEETGIDHLFVDEAHKFKNLSFITRLTRVKGLANSASQRAEDLFLKIRYLEGKRPGRSAVFATGTPISNTMAELWTMMRYLQLDRLKERDLDVFDSWASTFGRVQSNMELSADGRTLKEVSSFSRFVNIPELISLYSEIADTKTADMLNLPRPEVRTRSGAPGVEIVEAEPSSEEEAYIQELVKLAESMKGRRPKPGEPNMLSVVTMGRKVATDGRLASANFDFNPQGKVAKAVENIHRIWSEGKAPGLVQMVFLDMGVPQARAKAKAKPADLIEGEEVGEESANKSRYNLYADIKQRLVDKGIPAKEIAFIHDADNDDKKARLFKAVRAGKVRVILGSSEKMGVGTNVQDQLIAMHHIDAPWKPAEVEQRDGRIVRQGNQNKAVQIYRYVTRRSFDAFMWQTLDRKAKFIGQVLSGAKGSRHAEDIDNPLPEAAEMKAAASGDPRILEHAETDRVVRQLEAQRRSFENARSSATWELKAAKSRIEQYERALPDAKADASQVQDISGDKFKVELGGKTYDKRQEAGSALLLKFLERDPRDFFTPKMFDVGTMSGFKMKLRASATYEGGGDGFILRGVFSLEGQDHYSSPHDLVINTETDPAGVMRRYENLLTAIRGERARLELGIKTERENVVRLERQLKETWPKDKELKAAIEKRDRLVRALSGEERAFLEKAIASIDPEAFSTAIEERATKHPELPPIRNAREAIDLLVRDLDDMRSRPTTERIMDTPERKKLQQDIALQLYKQAGMAQATPESVVPRRAGRRVDLVLGPPASGKSHHLVAPLLRGHGAVLLDADEAKLLLPEFDNGRGASVVHEESARITEDLLREHAMVPGDNIVQPMIGKNLMKINGLITSYSEAGYKVHLHFVDLDIAKALGRALSRYISGGRLLDPNYIDSVDHLPRAVFDQIKERPDVASYQVVSTDVPFGEPARLIESSGEPQAYPGLGGRGAPGAGEGVRAAEAGGQAPPAAEIGGFADAGDTEARETGPSDSGVGLSQGTPGTRAALAALAQYQRARGAPTDLGPFHVHEGATLGRQAQEYVVARGRDTGAEHLVAIDEKGAVIAHARGTETRMEFSPALEATLRDPDQSVVAHHNHPNNTGLSSDDIGMLALPGLAGVWAHGHEGSVARGSLTPQARRVLSAKHPDVNRAALALGLLARATSMEFFDPLRKAIERGLIDKDKAWEATVHIANAALARAGILDYRHNGDIQPVIDKFGLEPYIERAARQAAGSLFQHDRTSTGQGALAEPLRHPGDLGASFGGTPPDAGQPVQRPAGRGSRRIDRAEAAGQLRLPGLKQAERVGEEGPRPSFDAKFEGDDPRPALAAVEQSLRNLETALPNYGDRYSRYLEYKRLTKWRDTLRQAARELGLSETENPFAPPFYSAVERAVQSAKQEKAAPNTWLGPRTERTYKVKDPKTGEEHEVTEVKYGGLLGNIPGVKPEEIEWIGLQDWLRAHKGPVTKKEIADYVRANAIELKEVEHKNTIKWDRETNQLEGDSDLRHAEWQLPGGKNYRELLLTLPSKQLDKLPPDWTIKREPDGGVYVYNSEGRMVAGGATRAEAESNALFQIGEGGPRTEGRTTTEYHSSHWDEPNVLAHVRFNDRTIDGKRTLFLEEVQSDWHQTGKKRGYNTSLDTAGWRAEKIEDESAPPGFHAYDVYDAAGQLRHEVVEAATPEDAIRVAGRQLEGGVPDAPFKTTWPELSLKRMLRHAAENGYDQIAWTPGKVQVDRYDLSKHLSKVSLGASNNPKLPFNLIAYDKGMRTVLREDLRSLNDLPDIIGKEVAERLVAKAGPNFKYGDRNVELDTPDLRVGGEGMLGFYDQMLPAMANKLGKKYGARVGRSEIDTGPDEAAFRRAEHQGDSAAIADALVHRKESVHTLPITPALRDTAVHQGFALFQPENPFEGPRTTEEGFVLRLPFKERWGDPRFDPEDKQRALNRLEEIQTMPVRDVPWSDLVQARRDINEIFAQLYYYAPDVTEERVRGRSEVWLYMWGKRGGKPDSITTDAEPDKNPEVFEIGRAGKNAIEHLLRGRRRGVLDLLTNDNQSEPRGGGPQPERIGEKQRSGFYFAAGRKLAEVPDALFKQSGQAVIDWLRQAGVKRAEIDHFGLQEKFGNRKPATRAAFQQAIAERMFDFSRKTSWLNPEWSKRDYELGGTRAFTGPRIPGRGVYFERLMAFPKKLKSGEPFAPGMFEGGHWDKPGTWASWRGSVREVPGFGKMVVGEEGQSDFMQGAFGKDPRRPRLTEKEFLAAKAERSNYERVRVEARELLESIPYRTEGRGELIADLRPSGRELDQATWQKRLDDAAIALRLLDVPPNSWNEVDLARKNLDKLGALRAANEKFFEPGADRKYGTTEASFTPASPIDDSYVRTMVRDLIMLAAQKKADAIAISTSETTDRIQANSYSSAAHFYDNQLKPALERELRKLGDPSITLQKVQLPKAMGAPKARPYTVWAAKLPTKTHEAVHEGLSLFQPENPFFGLEMPTPWQTKWADALVQVARTSPWANELTHMYVRDMKPVPRDGKIVISRSQLTRYARRLPARDIEVLVNRLGAADMERFQEALNNPRRRARTPTPTTPTSPKSAQGEIAQILADQPLQPTKPQTSEGFFEDEDPQQLKLLEAENPFGKEPSFEGWHGSAADFKDFDLRFAGTGEGTEEEGHGVYIAGARETGDFHRRVATDRLPRSQTGALYRVRVHADQNAMLDLDAPLDQQPAVLERIRRSPVLASALEPDMLTFPGDTFRRALRETLSPDEASRQFDAAGIPGFKFFDVLALDRPKGTERPRNFVIFDTARIEITHKNGEPAALGLSESWNPFGRSKTKGRTGTGAGTPPPGGAAGTAGATGGRTAAGGGGAGAAPPGGGATAAAAPSPSGRGRPITGALMKTGVAKAFKNFWTSNFQPELFSDRALEADPLFARYKAATTQEKDALVHASESEWNYWNKRAFPENLRFMDEWERGMTPADRTQAGMMRRYKRIMDVNYAEDQAAGLDYGYIAEYLPHIWEKPDEWRAFAETRTAQVGPTWFQKKRFYEFIEDGLNAGLKLKYTNVIDLVVHRLSSSVDARQRMQLLYDLKRMGLAWEGAGAGTHLVARGWRAINAPDRQQWVLAPDVLRLWQNAVEAKGLWQAEHIGGGLFRGWMALKTAWVPIKLALSAFHPLHVLHIAVNDTFARAWGDITKGKDPVQALKTLAQVAEPFTAAPGATTGAIIGSTLGAMTPVGPIWGGIAGSIAGATAYGAAKRMGMPDLQTKGKKARKAWATRPSAQTPEQRVMVTLMKEGGFVPQLSEQLKIAAKRQLAEAFHRIRRREGGVSDWRRFVSAAMRRPVEILQGPIFEQWIPNIKAAAYLNEAAALLRRRPDLLTNDTHRRIALRAIGQQVDSRFGEKFYGTMFWNRTLKDGAIGSFLSLGWNYGFVQQYGGAVMEAVTRPLGVLPPFRPSEGRKTIRYATNKIPGAIFYMGTAALLAALITALYTGEDPKGLDFTFPRIGGENPDGSPRRTTTMFYSREIPMLLKHIQERGGNVLSGTWEMVSNKLMFEPFKELINNRDYYGYNVWDENAPVYQQFWQALKHILGDQTHPMSVTGGKHAAEVSGKPFQGEPETWLKSLTAKGVPESMLGFGPAPAYVEKTKLQNRISYLYREHVSPSSRPEEEGANMRDKMAVRTAIMIARKEKDSKALNEAFKKGKELGMSQDAMNKVGRDPSDLYLFSRLPNSDQKAILRDASPDEYKRYFPRAHQVVKTELNRQKIPAGAPVQ